MEGREGGLHRLPPAVPGEELLHRAAAGPLQNPGVDLPEYEAGEAAEDRLTPCRLEGLPGPSSGQDHLTAGKEEPGVPEADPPRGEDRAVRGPDPFQDRGDEVLVPGLHEPGGPEDR